MLKIKSTAPAAAMLILTAGTVANAQTPIADYQVQDSYNSSVGTIGPLSVVGTPGDVNFTDNATVDGQMQSVLSFQTVEPSAGIADPEGGVQTQTAGYLSSPADFTVVLLADFDIATDLGATKVLDFKNLSADSGLYINDTTGILEFNDSTTDIPTLETNPLSAPVVTDTYTQIVLTRDSSDNLVTVYQDGTEDFSFADTNNLAVLGDASATGNAYLTLFKDDGTGLGGPLIDETSVGDMARLRLYNGALTANQVAALDTVAVPEPACAVGLIVLLGAAAVRRRRNA